MLDELAISALSMLRLDTQCAGLIYLVNGMWRHSSMLNVIHTQDKAAHQGECGVQVAQSITAGVHEPGQTVPCRGNSLKAAGVAGRGSEGRGGGQVDQHDISTVSASQEATLQNTPRISGFLTDKLPTKSAAALPYAAQSFSYTIVLTLLT